MLQLKNATPFAAEIAVFPNEKGIDTLYSIVKATFLLQNAWVLADEQAPPQKEDEYWGEPGLSSIKVASDFHIGKSSTDIVMIGAACAPNQTPVHSLDVQLNVGQVNKTVRVTGDRVWMDGRVSAPKPFTSMPIVYEKAFGGRHQITEDQYMAEEKNPVGCSFKGKQSSSDLNKTPLPNIEDPSDPIQYIGDSPNPAGFGFCSPDWLPRRMYAGTYDENWQKNRAPYLPADFDRKFLNAAHPDLIYPGYLQGGEPLFISNMHPDGEIRAQLPQVSIKCDINLKGSTHSPQMNLETLILEPNQRQLAMVWRSEFECDKQVLDINEVVLKLTR
ncbi:DUF2169 domain-containing protein [Aliikangiella marina]|uniref:DUF2169 domain-containing protein n=1 Tax=Aliikangiella marina TaxID=1712262 RepID=A0A545TGN0_9GAMM|nr:DUF2169 domain-containing protein [Aliikangiella marina]TQV76394.1 DUF2169 domain-containing protein [Aliikangiella marina]